MKFDYERFTEKAFITGMADEFEAKGFKYDQNKAMEKIDRLTEELLATLTPEQTKIFNLIENYEINYEMAVQKQAFYKGYMLAHSLFIEK